MEVAFGAAMPLLRGEPTSRMTGGPNHQVQHPRLFRSARSTFFPTSGKGLGFLNPKVLQGRSLIRKPLHPQGARRVGSWLAKRVAELQEAEERKGFLVEE